MTFSDLPELIKYEVLYFLETNNFPMAKTIYDAWREKQDPSSQSLNQQHDEIDTQSSSLDLQQAI